MTHAPLLARPTATSRDVRAGCFVCSGMEAKWFGGNAQGVAARHHDATRHATWCDVYLSVRYGVDAADPRQSDIEDAIAGALTARGSGRVSLPLTDIDASAVAPAGVSAPEGRSSKPALAAAKPEHSPS